jgi:tetratricopeptide (TPR) repeat protein
MTTQTSTQSLMRTLARAELATQSENWPLAASLWETLVDANPVNGTWWNHLATALHHLDQFESELAALHHVLELGDYYPSHPAYRIARCHACLGNTPAALASLEQAVNSGLHDLDDAQDDDAFADLRDNPTFRQLTGIPEQDLDRDSQWRADVRFTAREIKRRAFSPFGTLSEPGFDATIETIVDRIPLLSDHQVILELARLLRTLNDGHARIRPPDDRTDLQRALPLSLFLFEEGLFVIATTPDHEDLLGAQLLQIGSHDIDHVLDAFDPLVTRDNDNAQWFKAGLPDWLIEASTLHALGLIDDPDQVPLTVRTLTGETHTITLAPDPAWPACKIRGELPFPTGWLTLHESLESPVPHYLRNSDLPFWFDYVRDEHLVYVQFNSVRDTATETIDAFGKRLYTFVDANPVDRLVLDMRWNGGGNTLQEWPFLRQIIANQKTNQRGSLFVIIGRNTFSAAQNGINFLDTHSNATFVGEPTGSSPSFIGETHPFTLPHSKVTMNISDLHWVGTWPGDTRKWIPPTIYIPPTFATFRQNRDPALDAIRGLHERLPAV